MQTGEMTFYTSQEDGIRITSARAIFGAKVYAMANISSVGMGLTKAKRWPGIALAILGLLAFRQSMGLGAVLLILGVAWTIMVKDVYHVHIGSSSGEADVRSSKDVEHITGSFCLELWAERSDDLRRRRQVICQRSKDRLLPETPGCHGFLQRLLKRL
jgi:hypothetical protein